MIINAYSVFDSVAGNFGVPFFAASDAVAKRSFYLLAKDPGSTVSLSPSDFTLYKIGSFLDISGEFKALDQTEMLCRASDFVNLSETPKPEV